MVVGELAQERDVVVIGGGPGGYTAAIRAAQLGREVTLIERENELGGVCLNAGCISSKLFSHVSTKWQELQGSHKLGIQIKEADFNYEEMVLYKNQTISQLRKGVEMLCRDNKIELIYGTASFLTEEKVGVECDGEFEIFTFKQVIISTGSTLVESSLMEHTNVIDARSLYNLAEIPEKLILYGNDYMAIEAAFSYKALGSEVYLVIEDEQFPNLDKSINAEVIRQMKKAKITILTNMSLREVKADTSGLSARFLKNNGEEITLNGSYMYLQSAIKGRTGDLGLARIGVECDENGFIIVNHECRTNLPHIFAIGDVTGGIQLAVMAINQGKVAAAATTGAAVEWSNSFVPTIIHSKPPIACVGLSEQTAISQGYRIKTGQFHHQANGYAAITNRKDGFSKVIIDADTEMILGVHLYGWSSVELISTAILALEMAAREEDMKFPLYPHPSANEGLLEVVESLVHQSIHQPRLKHVKIPR